VAQREQPERRFDQRLADAAAPTGASGNLGRAQRDDELAKKAETAERSADAQKMMAFRRDSAGARQAEEVRQRAAAARPAAAPPPPAAASGGAALNLREVVQSTPAWQYVSRPDAERLTGRRVLYIPELDVESVGVSRIDGRYVTRTMQRLPDGNPIEIVQEPAAARAQADRAEERSSVAAQPVRELAKDELGVTVLKVTRAEWVLTGRATLSQDSLRVLLNRAR
jgi:hypothetical protein